MCVLNVSWKLPGAIKRGRMGQIQTLGRLAVTGWRDDSEHDKGRTLVQAERMTGVVFQSCQNIYNSYMCPSPGDWQLGVTMRWIMTKKSDVSGKLELGA